MILRGLEMPPKWTIAIATVPPRAEKLQELLRVLMPQVDKYQGQIEVLIFFNNFERSIGYIRQKLLEGVAGEYICYIDDDDMIPEDYCDTIFPLLDGTDYIGFKVKFIDNGKDMPPVYHSLKYTHWHQDADGYYRGITHLNPIRTELARTSSFPLEYTIGEDEVWANGIKAKTEHFIDKPMYIYKHESDESIAYRPEPHDTPIRPKIKGTYFRFHPESTKNAYQEV